MLSPRAVCHLSRPLIVGTRVQVVPLFTPHFLLAAASVSVDGLSWLQMIAKEKLLHNFRATSNTISLPIQTTVFFFWASKKLCVVVKMIHPFIRPERMVVKLICKTGTQLVISQFCLILLCLETLSK